MYLSSTHRIHCLSFFFFNDTATTEIYTLSLHDALPIWRARDDLDPGRGEVRRIGQRQAREAATEQLLEAGGERSEEHTSELQSYSDLVCRLLLEKKKNLTTTELNRLNCS